MLNIMPVSGQTHFIVFAQKVLYAFFAASAATLINIRTARKHFEKLERMSQGHLALSK